jgi:chloramphenicol-sensitive protein RarD
MLRPAAQDEHRSAAQVGLLCGVGAYVAWGVFPLYFKLLGNVPPLYILTHRILWSVVFLAILTTTRKSWREIHDAVSTRAHLVPLLASTVLITVNWYTYIYSIDAKRVLQSSLGYFMNPLVNVLLGVVVMRETLRRWQIAGIVLAALGVGILTWYQHEVPWIALILAVSFGLYGLMRKTMHVGAMAGLTVETAILFFPALLTAMTARSWPRPVSFTTLGTRTILLLAGSGVITAVPLLLFAAAARRLRLSTLGFLQYIAPTGQFLLAVFVFGETFTGWHLASFTLIWSALVIYTTDSLIAYRNRERQENSAFAVVPALAQPADDGAEPTA